MRKIIKTLTVTLAIFAFILTAGLLLSHTNARAAGNTADSQAQEVVNKTVIESDGTTGKSIGAGVAIGLAALGGAIAMGWSISKSNDGIARQPEATDNIRTLLMLGLVFIETVVIYSLIISILIIFVL